MADPEVYNYVSFGLEGVHYYEENGEKFLTEEYENRRWQILLYAGGHARRLRHPAEGQGVQGVF